MSVIGVEGVHYRRDGSFWIARGRVSLSANERSALIKGVDRPIRGVNCGTLPGVARQDIFPSNGLYTMAPGQSLTNATIHGRLKTAAGCYVSNVWTRGQSVSGTTVRQPILDLTDSTSMGLDSVLIEDSDFTPAPENRSKYHWNAKGGGGRIRRSVLAGLADGMQVFDDHMLFEQCWIGDLLWSNPDPLRTDGQASHNDGIQFEGGSGKDCTLDGCLVDVWEDNPDWTNKRSIFGFLMTANRGTPRNLRLINSWWRGGSYPINPNIVPTGVVEVTGNRIVPGQDPTFPGYHIIASSSVQSMWTQSGNTSWSVTGTAPNDVWTQTGSGILVKQG